ncbi:MULTISPECIES: DUF5133 domain-containing protein [Streptomyces]|nr:DUF5133 domain-containing protein [Streptomyces changanensis]
MAHPAVLSKLAEEYASLEARRAQADGPEVRRRMEDVAYTLCVSTGTRDVEDALAAVRRRLAEVHGNDPVLAL